MKLTNTSLVIQGKLFLPGIFVIFELFRLMLQQLSFNMNHLSEIFLKNRLKKHLRNINSNWHQLGMSLKMCQF